LIKKISWHYKGLVDYDWVISFPLGNRGSMTDMYMNPCDTQHVLPYGTVQEVKDETKRRIDDLALH